MLLDAMIFAPMGDLTATATLVLAGIAFALVMATVTLVWVTRVGMDHARHDAQREIDLMQRQLEASYRPLLIEVLPTGPITPDMGAHPDPRVVPNRREDHPHTIEIKFG